MLSANTIGASTIVDTCASLSNFSAVVHKYTTYNVQPQSPSSNQEHWAANMDATVITHSQIKPSAFHAETHLSTWITAAFTNSSLLF